MILVIYWRKNVTINEILLCYHITQINSTLPWFCLAINHRRYQNVVITLVTLYGAFCDSFLFLTHFEVIYDLWLNRHTATWNLFLVWNDFNSCFCCISTGSKITIGSNRNAAISVERFFRNDEVVDGNIHVVFSVAFLGISTTEFSYFSSWLWERKISRWMKYFICHFRAWTLFKVFL